MGGIILTDAPSGDAKGERDLNLEEITRKSARLLGRRGSTYKGRNGLCVVAVFADDHWDRSPVERTEIILGEGLSFAEAFRRAEESLANGRAHRLNLSEPIPPRHSANDGKCIYGCHR